MDYITVTKDNGEIEAMEVVAIFNKSDSDYNYIIYKSLNGDDYYTAKYIGEEIANLDVNLDEEETKYTTGIFKALVGER